MEMVQNIFIAWVSLVTTWDSLAQLYAMPEDLKGYEIMKSTGSHFAVWLANFFMYRWPHTYATTQLPLI